MSKQLWKSGALYYENGKARKFFPFRIAPIFKSIIPGMELKDGRERIGKKQIQMCLIVHFAVRGTTPLTGERAQATLRGRPRGRLGTVGSGNGCLRGRPRGRFGSVESDPTFFRDRLGCLGSIQGAGAIL